MPEIALTSSEAQKVRDIVQFVSGFIGEMSPEGRMVLALQLVRLFDPEIKELRRKAENLPV